MSQTLITAALLTSLLAGCAELSGHGDITTSNYKSFQEASQQGAFESGWLPRALPRSATNIVEVHNIDSSELWVRFRYANNDIQNLTKECAPGRKVQLPNAKRTKRDASWWPEGLTEGSDEQSLKPWLIVSCANMRHAESAINANVAVDPASRTAWYWMAR